LALLANLHMLAGGADVSLLWTPENNSTNGYPSLWTSTALADGGQALPLAGGLSALNKAGVGAVPSNVTWPATGVGELATATNTFIVNATSAPVTVTVNGAPQSVPAYGYVLVPAATATATPAATAPAADTAAPTVPGGVVATAGAAGTRRIAVKWTASTDTGGSGLKGYELLRATASTGPYGLVATTTSPAYTNAGLVKNKRYWYQVRAFDGAGNRSGVSATVTAVAK
jgi:hypothetical protein